MAAIQCPADLLGYGGQAGGGKSDLLLGCAGTQHTRSIIFRREAKQGRSMIDRSREIFGGHGRFNETTGIWRDLPGGRQLEFAGVKDPNDVLNFRGQPHDLIGIDEADSFLESQVRFLLGWLRTTVPGQRCRAILCFNPPARAEGRWLLQFFGPWVDRKHPNPALPGELRWYATVRGGKEVERPDGQPFEHEGEWITPKSRSFIPASVKDNPYLLASGYVAQLQSLPEPLRSQLLYGDFSAGVEDDPWQVIPTAWIEAAMARWQPKDSGVYERIDALGVDVARGGAANTVLAARIGRWFAPLERFAGADTDDGPKVAALVWRSLTRSGDGADLLAAVNIDSIGVGASAFDSCKAMELNVIPVNFGGGAYGRDRSGVMEFRNMRAYAWWALREALDPEKGDNLALPPDNQLLADLSAPRWSPVGRLVKLEEKPEIEKRLGRSPDSGDAVVLANLCAPQADGVEPVTIESAGWTETRGGRGSGDRPTRWGRR